MADRITIANIPSVLTSTTGTVLVANPGRTGFSIQNSGTNPLFVLLGAGCTNNGTYHIVLKGGSAVGDGSGATFSLLSGVSYTGIVSASGTAPSFTVLEM